ncbi:MAG: LysM domain-containing protein [Pseudomonadota bacterium]
MPTKNLKLQLVVLLVTLSWISPIFADNVQINPNHPGNYTVVRGDTLWDIAGMFLSHPWQWPDIWQVNPQIENPHLIYPGDQVSLTYRDGKPILSLSQRGLGGRNVKLSPSVRAHRHDDRVAPIPLDAIHQFLSRPQVIGEREFDRLAYVVASQDRRVTAAAGDKIYVRGLGQPSTDKYSVFRPGGAYRDGDTGELLGYEAMHIADVVLDKLGDPATAYVQRSNREILEGDRLVPQQTDEYPDFVPSAPNGDVNGNIISVIDGVSQIGQYQVVVLDRGIEDGLVPGNVLAIFQKGEVVKDRTGTAVAAEAEWNRLQQAEIDNPTASGRLLETFANDLRAVKRSIDNFFNEPKGGRAVLIELPEERAGELMVFRAFDDVSYGLVMNTQRPVHIADRVRNP